MKTGVLALACLFLAHTAAAQGTIAGCVRDRNQAVLPGVDVVATGPAGPARTTTGSSGCFELRGLAAGRYSVTATLAGFVPAVRDGVVVVDGGVAGPVVFDLCLGRSQEEVIVIPRFATLWQESDVVALIEIIRTEPVKSECPYAGWQHTARVREILKDRRPPGSSSRLVFNQFDSPGSRAPYPVGTTMVVLLKREADALVCWWGPFSVFRVAGDRVLSQLPEIPSQPLAQFLARLRAMAAAPPKGGNS